MFIPYERVMPETQMNTDLLKNIFYLRLSVFICVKK